MHRRLVNQKHLRSRTWSQRLITLISRSLVQGHTLLEQWTQHPSLYRLCSSLFLHSFMNLIFLWFIIPSCLVQRRCLRLSAQNYSYEMLCRIVFRYNSSASEERRSYDCMTTTNTILVVKAQTAFYCQVAEIIIRIIDSWLNLNRWACAS
jgi:hypothetical protein